MNYTNPSVQTVSPLVFTFMFSRLSLPGCYMKAARTGTINRYVMPLRNVLSLIQFLYYYLSAMFFLVYLLNISSFLSL